jgi:hypothetical protein
LIVLSLLNIVVAIAIAIAIALILLLRLQFPFLHWGFLVALSGVSLILLSNPFLVFDGCWLLGSNSGPFVIAWIDIGGELLKLANLVLN